MAQSLSKGGNVDIVKEAGGTLTRVRCCLGWDAKKGDGPAFDLDASIIALGDNGLSVGEDWFVFYNRLTSPGSEIVHMGDERTGDTEGDDEQIVVNLAALPATIHELAVAITIHEAAARGGQNFGLVDKAYVRIVNEDNGAELARFDLSEDGAGYNSVVMGKLYRHDGGWKFKALADTSNGELSGLIDAYKVV